MSSTFFGGSSILSAVYAVYAIALAARAETARSGSGVSAGGAHGEAQNGSASASCLHFIVHLHCRPVRDDAINHVVFVHPGGRHEGRGTGHIARGRLRM